MTTSNSIKIKSPAEIEILREAGKILASIVEELKSSLKTGMTTLEVDKIAENLILDAKVMPAFKGYRGFEHCTCTSMNHEVVHGIPSDKKMNEGDIVSIDVGIIHKDFYSDTAFTIGIGTISDELQSLLDITYEALNKGIKKAIPGHHLSDISHAVQEYVESNNLSVVRDFVGHGIGRDLHEDPEVPNFGPPHCGPVLEEGMVLAIEPMVNIGTWKTKILDDGWTVITEDKKPSAHFEHTIAITSKGPEILTQ